MPIIVMLLFFTSTNSYFAQPLKHFTDKHGKEWWYVQRLTSRQRVVLGWKGQILWAKVLPNGWDCHMVERHLVEKIGNIDREASVNSASSSSTVLEGFPLYRVYAHAISRSDHADTIRTREVLN